jgi:hypothetical protein
MKFPGETATRIGIKGVNREVYDVTSKPRPASFESGAKSIEVPTSRIPGHRLLLELNRQLLACP